MTTLKIVVPIAENDEVPQAVREGIGGVLTAYPGSTYVVVRGGPGDNWDQSIARNRNEGIRRGGYEQYDYVISQDSDVLLTVEAVKKLLSFFDDGVKAAVVSGAYIHRGLTDRYCASEGKSDRDFVSVERKGTIRVQAVGGGALCIPTPVLKALDGQWFATPCVENKQVSDDIGFSLNAMNADIPLYLDCDCVVRHLPEADRMGKAAKQLALLRQNLTTAQGQLTKLERVALCNEAQEALTKVGAIVTVLRRLTEGENDAIR